MSQRERQKHKILIADDCQLNRELLVNMLEDQYELVEASNGAQAVDILHQRTGEISLLLLDLNMPEMDGFDVLAYMNRYHWIEDIPVMVISVENSDSCIERAYGLGVTDFIRRPYNATVVRCRIQNTLMLSARQRDLMGIVNEQIREKKRGNELMVSILSHIVEFRNGESGPHVVHIGVVTDLLLHRLVQKTNHYALSENEISLIVTASALHDIGKIIIPDEIINKPGHFTPEEYEIMKGHAMAGAEMLDSLLDQQRDQPLVRVAYEICRWHHERYDGGGYPDRLKGEDIPISAQVVSLADTYDALVSKRCYKDSYTHEEAMEMILSGRCGAFNPLLLECLKDIGDAIQENIQDDAPKPDEGPEVVRLASQLEMRGLSASDQLIQQLYDERQHFQFLYETAREPLFWYTVSPSLLNVNEACKQLLGLDRTTFDPKKDEAFLHSLGAGPLRTMLDHMYETSPARPEVSVEVPLEINGQIRGFRYICRTIWAVDDPTHYTGAVGRLMDLDWGHKDTSVAKLFRHARELVQNGVCAMTGAEAQVAMEYLTVFFETVRLVDVDVCCQVDIDPSGRCRPREGHCYDTWGKSNRCENCSSAKCVSSKQNMSKVEFVGEKVYRVQSMYVEVDGKPYAMELVSQIGDENMLEGYSKEAVLKAIEGHNKTLYTDPLTHVYNRRYYEDHLCQLSGAHTVAMLDVDDFKNINDTWGHQAGDVALFQIAQAIQSCVRATDSVVRYGGDEFVVVFRDIPEEVFYRKLEEIQAKVKAIKVEHYPEMQCAVSIGGCYGEGTVSQLLRQADREMYRDKRKRKMLRQQT